MNQIKKVVCTTLFFSLFTQHSFSLESVDSGFYQLNEIIEESIKKSPDISAYHFRELAQDQGVKVAKSDYMPTLKFEAIESNGFPGSSGGLGISGVMGSPFRSGYAYGIEFNQKLLDFGRTAARVSSARNTLAVAKLDSKIAEYQTALRSTVLFYQCSALQSSIDTWSSLLKEYSIGKKETEHYVETGQRSVVDRYLVSERWASASARLDTLQIKLEEALNRIGIITGLPEKKCPPLETLINSPKKLTDLKYFSASLFSEKARLLADQKQSYWLEKKREHLPYLVAVGSVGEMESNRLVAKKDFSLGIGLVIPLFSGLKISGEEKRASLDHLAAEQGAAQEDQNEKLLLSELHEKFKSSKSNRESLEKLYKSSWDGFMLAKNRYLRFQGNLADLLAATANLEKTSMAYLDTQFEWLVTSEQLNMLQSDWLKSQ